MLGASIRYNVIPTSVKEASLQIQIYPRSLSELTKHCQDNGVSLSSPAIPGLIFKPQNKQAMRLHFAVSTFDNVEC